MKCRAPVEREVCDIPSLTLTMASLVCAMSEMTPSVMMSSTEYWEPSCTAAAFLRRAGNSWVRAAPPCPTSPAWGGAAHLATWVTTGAKLVGP